MGASLTRGARRWALAVAGTALVAGVVWAREPLAAAVLEFAGWVDGLGGWAPVVFVAGFALGVVCLVPATPLLLAGGVVFGLPRGLLYGFLGMALGGLSAFLLARLAVRKTVERRLAGREEFLAINRALAAGGLWPVILVRLSPAVPAWMLNYGLGVTQVRWTHYLVASVAIVPTVALYVYYGQAVGDLAALGSGRGPERGPWYFALLAAGLAATVAVTALLTRRSQRILERMSAQDTHGGPEVE